MHILTKDYGCFYLYVSGNLRASDGWHGYCKHTIIITITSTFALPYSCHITITTISKTNLVTLSLTPLPPSITSYYDGGDAIH